MAGFKSSGLNEFQKKLNDLEKNLKKIDGESNVKLEDLLTPKYLARNCGISNIDEFFEKGEFVVESASDFEAIQESELDKYVQQFGFQSWQDMLSDAGAEYVKGQLGF